MTWLLYSWDKSTWSHKTTNMYPMQKYYLSIALLNHYRPTENAVRGEAYQQLHTFHSHMKKKLPSTAYWIQNKLKLCFALLCVLNDQHDLTVYITQVLLTVNSCQQLPLHPTLPKERIPPGKTVMSHLLTLNDAAKSLQNLPRLEYSLVSPSPTTRPHYCY